LDKDFERVGGAAAENAAQGVTRCRSERRTDGDRRRSPQGWLEIRARRDGVEVDRRRLADEDASWVRRLGAFRRGGRT
jgi:hypothetical protein